MHLLAPRAPAKSVPPRCPFCQATIRGFTLPPAAGAAPRAPTQPQVQLPALQLLAQPAPAAQPSPQAQQQLPQAQPECQQQQPTTPVQWAPTSQVQ